MARTSTVSSTEVLAGLVDRVTFHNPENGLCVLRVKTRGQRDLITVVGHAAMISAGEFVQAKWRLGRGQGGGAQSRVHGLLVVHEPGRTTLMSERSRPGEFWAISRLRPQCLHLVSRFVRREQE
jgi:hypothetical protein